MPKHRRGMLTPYEPVTPLRPPGSWRHGTVSEALALLDVAHGYACGAPPWIRRRGADTGAHCTSSTAF